MSNSLKKRFDEEFIDISISILSKIEGPLPFDVHIRRAKDVYTKLFPKDEIADMDRYRMYELDKGIKDLFVTRDDYRQYLLFVERIAKQVMGNLSKSSPNEVLHVVKEMVSLTMFEIIVEMNVDQTSVNHAAQAVKGCLDVLATDPKGVIKLIQLLTTHPYVIKHSISTAVFAILLARKEGLEAQKSLTSVGLGAFLHDLGMSRLPFDPESKEELTPEEWKMVKEHPQLGKRLLDPIKSVSSEVRIIVLQHHEQPNGAGYPDGLHDKEIFYLAKMIAIADSFAALVSKRPFRNEAFSPAQALAMMSEERGKFDKTLLDSFSTLFLPIKSSK